MGTTEIVQAIRGICPHGKVKFIAGDTPEILKACRKDISDMVAAGYSIDRVPAKDAGKSYDPDCAECDKKRAQP